MSKLFIIRNFIQQHDAKHWQFLVLTIIISILGSIISLYGKVFLGSFIFYLSLLITSLFISLFSYFYMHKKGEASKVFFSLSFAVFTFFLSEYLVFEHYFDFFLEAYIDRSILSLNHIAFYYRAISFDSVFYFVNQMPNFIGIFDFLILVLMLVIALLYLVLPFDNCTQNTDSENKRVRFNNRRFG